MHSRPSIAIIDPNALSAVGLRHLLQSVMPFAAIDCFPSFLALPAGLGDSFFHYFVAQQVLECHRSFFAERQKKTIVLTANAEEAARCEGFHCLCVNQPEEALVHQLLALEQHAHRHGRNLPQGASQQPKRVLSDREVEVMKLIIEGLINKEIAERLCISVNTVLTHRRNIMEKLGIKSVSALTIYAVMHGYVNV